MAKLLKYIFLALGLGLFGVVSQSYAQSTQLLVETAKSIGTEKICNLADVPGGVSAPKPTSAHHRATLYLRCEAMGGGVPPPDGIAKNSCCEHLKPGELQSCPDAVPEVNVPARIALRAFMTCPKP